MSRSNFKGFLSFVFVIAGALIGQSIPLPENIENLIESRNIGPANTSEIQDFIKNNNPQFKDDVSPFEKNNNKIEKIINSEQDLMLNENIDNDIVANELTSSDDLDEMINSKETLINEVNSDTAIYYGYKIFERDPDNFQNSINSAVDPNYIVGYGDEIIIMLWGETESYDEYLVSKDGYIFVKNIGQVFVNGLTLEKVEKTSQKSSKVFSNFRFK